VVCELSSPEALVVERPRLITTPFAMVMLSSFAYFIGIGAMMPVLPRYIRGELDGNDLEVSIGVLGSFSVTAALLRPWVGRTGDVRGRRVLTVGGALVAGVSILGYSLASSLPLLVLARLMTGAGEAAFFTGVLTANQDMAPDDRRGEAASYFSVALYGGLALGPFLGESLLKATNFTTVFVVFGCVTLLAAVAGWGVPVGDTVDRAPERAILHRAALWPGMVLAMGLVPLVAYNTFLPLYADEVGFDHVGSVLAMYGGLILTIRIVGARLPDTLGWRVTSWIALLGVAGGLVLLGAWGSAPSIWIGTITLAIGMSLLYPALLTAVMNATPDGERSHAVGTFTLFFDMAQGIGGGLVGAVVFLGNERVGFVAAGLCAMVGLVTLRAVSHRIGVPVEAA
jgi:MFS family permease